MLEDPAVYPKKPESPRVATAEIAAATFADLKRPLARSE